MPPDVAISSPTFNSLIISLCSFIFFDWGRISMKYIKTKINIGRRNPRAEGSWVPCDAAKAVLIKSTLTSEI